MKIILIGCNGKMGQMLSHNLKNDVIVSGIDITNSIDNNYSVFKEINLINSKADIIIDFSTCDDRKTYIDYAAQQGLPYACFSTIISKQDEISFKSLSKRVPVLICSNASIGVNLLFDILHYIQNKIPSKCDIVLTEYHHKQKLDSPSGTAKEILKILNNKNVDVKSFRVSNVVGTHKLELFLEDEKLEITHIANSKKIFIIGALAACRKLIKKENGIYKNIDELN